MNEEIIIRPVDIRDAEELLKIYSPYVENSAITFEWDVPDKREFQRRIEEISYRYPYLVAEKNGNIVGYTYANHFKERISYAWSVETTIYIESSHRREGIGEALYGALEENLKKQHITNLNACIAETDRERDEYLDSSSILFHSRMGYHMVGKFRECAYKKGRWYNMVWMEKIIAEHPKEPEKVIPFSAL